MWGCRHASIVLCIDVGAARQHRRCSFEVTPGDRPEKRRLARAGPLLDVGAVAHEQTDGISVAVVRRCVERMLRAGAKFHQVFGQLEVPPKGHAVPYWRRTPTSFRERVIAQIDSVRHQDVRGANAGPGIATIEQCRAAHMQPVAAALIPMLDELRLLPQSRIDGPPIEGPYERQQGRLRHHIRRRLGKTCSHARRSARS